MTASPMSRRVSIKNCKRIVIKRQVKYGCVRRLRAKKRKLRLTLRSLTAVCRRRSRNVGGCQRNWTHCGRRNHASTDGRISGNSVKRILMGCVCLHLQKKKPQDRRLPRSMPSYRKRAHRAMQNKRSRRVFGMSPNVCGFSFRMKSKRWYVRTLHVLPYSVYWCV